ncbi:MAG: VWA domain-containing protein [Acidobacteriota bacterium]
MMTIPYRPMFAPSTYGRLGIFGCLALLLCASPWLIPAASAQEAAESATAAAGAPAQEDPLQQLFLDVVDVNIVNIDVYVTDRDNKPVLGLTADDFEIFENGKPMTVSNFYAVENGVPTEESGVEAVDPNVPDSVPDHLVELKIPEDQRLHLIVFIDNFNIRPFNRNRVMREVRLFLDRNTRPEDRVMLMSYNRSLKIEQEFTADPRLIGAGLRRLEKNTGYATIADNERDEVMDRIDESNDEFTALGQARMYAESIANDLTFTVKSLKEMVDSLAGLPGRKAILHVSDGIPMIPGEDIFHYVEERFRNTTAINDAFTYDYSRRFTELTASANANRVSFYTIDAGGLRVASFMDASKRGGVNRGPFIDTINTQNLQNTLHFMADSTGGRAIVNRNRVLPALNEVADDLRNYYSLGYSPGHSGDGRLYKLKVKVDRDDVKVRYRENYRDKSLANRMSERTLAALRFGYESNPLELSLDFGDARPRQGDRHYLVPVYVRIPLSEITLVPQGEMHQGRVRLYFSAIDDRGGTSPVSEQTVPISIPTKDFPGALDREYVFTMELLMRQGNQRLAVGLRDDLGTDTSFVSRVVSVGA